MMDPDLLDHLRADPRWAFGLIDLTIATPGGPRTEFIWTSPGGSLAAVAYSGPLGPGRAVNTSGVDVTEDVLAEVAELVYRMRWTTLGCMVAPPAPDPRARGGCSARARLVWSAGPAKALVAAVGTATMQGSFVTDDNNSFVVLSDPRARLRVAVPAFAMSCADDATCQLAPSCF